MAALTVAGLSGYLGIIIYNEIIPPWIMLVTLALAAILTKIENRKNLAT